MRVKGTEHAVDGSVHDLVRVDWVNIILLYERQRIGKGFKIFIGILNLFIFLSGKGRRGGDEKNKKKTDKLCTKTMIRSIMGSGLYGKCVHSSFCFVKGEGVSFYPFFFNSNKLKQLNYSRS